MKKFKLIAVCADEFRTAEFQHTCNNIEEATQIANELLDEYIEDYPDTYIAMFPYDGYIKPLEGDFPCYVHDMYDERYWMRMKVGTYCPINRYLLEDGEDEIIDIIENYGY